MKLQLTPPGIFKRTVYQVKLIYLNDSSRIIGMSLSLTEEKARTYARRYREEALLHAGNPSFPIRIVILKIDEYETELDW